MAAREYASGMVLDGRFRIVKMLGAGAFGAVYQATQLVFDHPLREVALKLFKVDRVDPDKVHDIFADAITLVGLQEEQPGTEIANRIVQVYDLGMLNTDSGPQPFISMRLVDGGNFETIVSRFRDGGMTVKSSLRYLRELLIPLAWMHSVQTPVVHGDLKPDNILVGDQQRLIVTDFGLASRLPVNSLGGAIQYQAPETLAGRGANLGADVYAVGIIWYEMLTGTHPFKRVGLDATARGDNAGFIRAHLDARKWPIEKARPGYDHDRIVPVAELNPEFESVPQLDEMLRRCLAYLPSERYDNAWHLKQDLEKYLSTGDASNRKTVRAASSGKANDENRRLADVEALIRGQRAKEALSLIDQLLEEFPHSLEAQLVRVRALMACKRRKSALELAQRLAAAQPGRRDVMLAFAEALHANGKRQLADSIRQQASG